VALPFTAFAAGSILCDRYELVRRLARGGMGDVFEAEDLVLHRRVAVKVYRSAAPEDRARFEAEVRLLAGLSHPGLVRVFDAGEHDGDAFVVLELVEGPTLRAAIADRGALPPGEVAAVGAALADALACVHDNGIVHRDVTPSNVLLDREGRPRLADFGIARLLDTSRITATATTIGTAAYMAPEQVQGASVTPAADIYAMGLVLLEALTATRAFQGSSHEVAVARLVRDPEIPHDLPGAWRDLVAAMTARDADARPPAHEVGRRLERVRHAVGDATRANPAVALPATEGDAPTEALAAVEGGMTAAMPAAMIPTPDPVPDPPPEPAPVPEPQPTPADPPRPVPEPEPVRDRAGAPAVALASAQRRSRAALVVAGLVLLLALVTGLASRDGSVVPTGITEPLPSTTTTATTAAPTTTTTAAPAPPPDEGDDERPKPGKGRDQHDKGNDDDD
jgi:tRNA A-37 threonylcarbamoyl transferase component Bud32